ncbi:hypothetical protein MTO96_006813 [Rhipicephalus appendiculatus]
MAGRASDCEDPNLQKYESSLYKFKDERDAIQKKTFTKWVNKHLIKANKRVDDLFVDLQDGHSLLSLLEVLSGETLPREKGRMRFHMLQNVQTALTFLRYRKVKLVNIRAEDIVDGNPKLTLGLIWTIILHFQISDITFTQNNENLTAKDALLRWAQRTTDRYPGVKVRDFTSSWRDGLAFNAIIHRNRPDLVDFRSCRTRTVRENLEVAFSVAERELGVTRLLDPEDVDTPQPDEKSLITYISSLYDVFPEPASHHPFAEDEKLRKAEEYRDLSSSLHTWLRTSTTLLQSRSFPPTLSEVKQLQTENARFRQEEVPPRLQDKQRLTKLWRDEVHSLVREQRLHVDAELTPDNLEASWQRMLTAHADRERALKDEAVRLEKLQRLAEKVHREAKNCDARLDDVERRISDEEPRLGRLHPADAKRVCDQVDRDLRHIEDTLKALFRDVQLLFDGRYHRASELHKLVQKLHQRWSDLRLAYQQRLLAPLSSKQYKLEERKVTKQRQVISESRLVETHEYLKFLQSCLDWVQEKLRQLETVEWGCEVPAVQAALERHQADHRLIDQFQKNVDMCISRQGHFEEGSEERAQYQKQLAQLERGFSELLVLSNKRLSDLDALLEFAQSAAAEMRWLQERQQPEVMRDWSSPTLNLVDLEQHQGTLTAEVEARESTFNATLDLGSSLVRQQHPAARAIEAQLSALQAQWAWLLELLRALEAHLRHAAHYHQFFKEARECEQWMQRGEERLNTTFSRPSFSLEEGERLLQQMQELREDLARYAGIVNALLERSRQVLPLKQRRAPLPRPLRVTAVCSYSQLNMTVARGEQCWLHDNTQRDRWKVANAKGHEGQVPGVCFMIPPPNPEAIELAESLKRKYDLVVKLWTKKQHKLRLNMIFATIKIVKAWDLKTFRAMEPSQRESIIRALNEDAEKLLAEGGSREVTREPESPFADLSARLEKLLQEKERTLNSRTQAHIPRDVDSLDALVVQHKEFEEGLQDLEPQVAEMRVAFKQMTKKTPTTQDRHDGVVRLWDRIWNLSHLYVERLKAVEIANHGLSEATTFVSSVEEQLAAQGPMPEEQTALRQVHEDLVALQLELQQQQPQLDRLAEDVASVRKVTERSRPNAYSHPDVRKLEDDLRKVVRRWDNAANQLAERLRSCEAASELLRAYRNKMDEERNWASQATVRVNAVKTARPSVDRQQALDLYTEVSGRRPRIEEVNVLGGRFTREAQIYGLRLQRFAEGLEQDHPSLDGSLAAKRRRLETTDGSGAVAAEVNELNARYLALAEDLAKALDQQCTAVLTETSAVKTLTKTREFKTFTETSAPRTFAEAGAPRTSPAEEAATDEVSLPDVVRSGALRIDRWLFVDIATGQEYSLDEAVAKGLLDSRLKAALLEPCGIRDASGTELSLRAAIDKRLYDPERATLLSPKSGRPITVEEAIQLGIIKREKVVYLLRLRLIRITELSLAEARDRGLVNLVTGFVNDPNTGIPVPLDEAFAKGWLVRERVEDSEGMTLSYALDTGLVDDATGKLRDQHSGDQYTLREALAQGLLSADTAEVADTREGTLVTLPRALRDGLLLDTGRYVNPATKEQHTLSEARKRLLLNPPLTLKDAHDRGLLDEDGQVKNPWTGTWMTLLEAISIGLLDPYVKCIVHPRTQEALSLSEALAQGVVTPDGRFVNLATREVLTLSQAVRLGFCYICLPENNIQCLSLPRPHIWKIGLKDDTGRELTLSEAVFEGLIDPNTGQIRDRKTKLPIPLKEALAKGVITPEGAALLRGLLRITVSTATVTKTITRYVTVSSHGSQDAPLTAEDQTLQDAVQSGLLSPDTEWPTDIGDLGKRTPVTPEPIRRTEAHLVYDDTEDITGEGSVLHSSRRVVDKHLETFGEYGDIADQVDQLLKDVPQEPTVTDSGLPRTKPRGSPPKEATDKDFSRPPKERKVPISHAPPLTADEEESIHTVTYHVTSRHEFFEKSHVVHDMHTGTLEERSDEVTRGIFDHDTDQSKRPDTLAKPDKDAGDTKDRMPTDTGGKRPGDTSPVRTRSPTKTPDKDTEHPTGDKKRSTQLGKPSMPEPAAGKPVLKTLRDKHGDVSEHKSVEDVRVSVTQTSTRSVDISPTKEPEQVKRTQPSPPAVSPKGKKSLPLGQTPSEGSPVATKEPFTKHVLSENVTENKESVLIEEMLEEVLEESRMRDDLPGGREVSPLKGRPGSPEEKEKLQLRDVSESPTGKEVTTPEKMFDVPSKEVRPLEKAPETQRGRDVSPLKQSPESPHSDVSLPKRVPGAREVSPLKKTPGAPEGRDVSPAKQEPGLTKQRDGSPSKSIPATPEGRVGAPLQKAPEKPEAKDTSPSKHVPGIPEKRDVSPPKRRPGSVSPEKRDTSPPKTTPEAKEDKAAFPPGEAPRTPEEREVSTVRRTPGMPEDRDVPLPKRISASPERRDVSPTKRTPVVPEDARREGSPLTKAPEMPEGRPMSPSEREPGKLEGRDLSPLRTVPGSLKGRDASPPKKVPGRDVSPVKKVPGTPEGRLSPSKKVPGSPEKKDVSPSRKMPETAEHTTLGTVPYAEENKNGILQEHGLPEQMESFDVSVTSKVSETFETRVLFPGKQMAPDMPEGRDVSPSRKAPGQRGMSPPKELAGTLKSRDVSPLEKTPGKSEDKDIAPERKSPTLLKSRDSSPPKKAPGVPGVRGTSPSKQKAPETQELRDVSPAERARETPERKHASPEKKRPEMPEQQDIYAEKAPETPKSKDVKPFVQQNVPETPDSAGTYPSGQKVPEEPGRRHASPPRKVPETLQKKDEPTPEKVLRKPETRDVSPPKRKPSEAPKGRDASPSRKVQSKPKSREASPSKQMAPETVKSTETLPPKEPICEVTESRQHKFEVEVLDIPPGGWYLKDAIEQGLFDAKEGLFLIPGTDRLVSLEETLKMQILNSDSATVHEPGSKRTLTLTRALEKNLLSATGHYRDAKTKQTWTMEEAIKRKVVILLQRPDSAAPGHGPARSIHVTRVVGQPDIVEVKARELEASKQDFPKFSELEQEEPSADSKGPQYRTPGPASTVASILKGSADNEEVIIREASTRKEIKLKDAVGKGVIDLGKDTYTDKNTGRSWKIEEAIKTGMLAIVGAPLLLGAKAIGALRESATDEVVHATATSSEPIRTTHEITKVVRHTSLLIRDATTGQEVPLEEAVALGLISEDSARELQDGAKTTTEQSVHTTTTVLVTDPVTGETMTLAEALEQGCLDSETAAKLQRGNVTGVVTSVQTCLEGSGKGSTVAYQELLSAPREVTSKHVEEARYAVPRFEVTLGRATSSQQPTLQKVRRLVVSPKEAQSRGIADKGLVLEPQQGHWLPQSEAEAAGLLDARTGDVLVPVGRPLSLPELVEQGLVEPVSQRIVHPETGALLTMEEAVLCDIANPMSRVPGPESPLTLEEALASRVVDKESGSLTVAPGSSVTLVDAVSRLKVFDKLDTPKSVIPIPMLAPTFPVALRRGSQPLSLDEVTKAGYLDLSTVLLDIDEGRIFTVQDGISSGYIDTETEKLRRHGREPMLIWEAIRSGFLVAIDAPLLPMLPRRFGRVTDDEAEDIKVRISPSKQHSPQTQPGQVGAGGSIPTEESSVPKRPARKMRSESPGSKRTATSSPSPSKEVAPKSPTKEVAPKSPTKEVAPMSPTKEVAPKSPTKEVAPMSPTKEVAPKSPTKEVAPKSPTKEVAPKSPTKEVAPKSPTKEVAPKSPTKEVAPKSPNRGSGVQVSNKGSGVQVSNKGSCVQVSSKGSGTHVSNKGS